MYLKTIGKPSKVQMKLCKEAVRFYGRHLLGEILYHRVEVTLTFDKTLAGKNEYAFCEWEDTNHRSKEFTVTVDSTMGKRNMLLALAHEMVHVKQYAKGELKDYLRSNKSKWMSEIIDPAKTDYWDFPWEIEAHGREKGLYIKFLNRGRSR
jgi:hypothetical protein